MRGPPQKDAPPFGRRLAVLRRQKGLSQKELAERLDTTQKTADYYERRALNSTLDLVERVAAALKVPAAEIIGDGVAPTRLSKKAGPRGKCKRSLKMSPAPRRQQEKIVEFVSAFVRQYEQERH